MNTLFKKQFFMQAFVLIVSFILLGIGLTQAFSSFFMEQKTDILLYQSRKVSKIFKQGFFLDNPTQLEQLDEQVAILQEYLGISFIFINSQNNIKVVSTDIDRKWLNNDFILSDYISPENIKQDEQGVYYETQGTLNGIFNEPVVSIGYPININEKFLGTIFLSIPVTEITSTLEKAYQIIILFTLFAIIISFVLVYIFTKRVTLPLRDITNGANIMAGGNLKRQIPIKTNDEIGQLAQVLNNMAESLDEQETRRREFISNISHDIRSPLTSMKGFLQAILDGTIPKEKQEKYLKVVLDETNRLTALSNNILDINKLDGSDNSKKKTEYVFIDINDMIRKIAISFEARAFEKKISINISFAEENTYVFTDPEKLQRIIYNLLDNALKFTEKDKKIYVTTTIKGDRTYISIRDEGEGISPEDQKRIFDRFYKSDLSRGKDKKGSGLGLSIVKEFVLSLGETIAMKSELGKGTEFIFTLTKDKLK